MNSRPKRGKTMAVAIVCAMLSAGAVRTFAQQLNPPTTQNPQLIVYARTDLKNQGAPTLDLLDLERYFAAQLAKRCIQNVAPSQTARQTRSPAQNEYLIELSVDAIQPSTRATQDYQTKVYTEDPVFYVELSLTLKHPASGRVQGTLVQRQDYHLAEAELERVEPKRNAIYKTADRLADEFVDAAGEGRFGAELKSIQAPLSTLVRPWHVLVGLGVLVFILIVVVASVSGSGDPEIPSPSVRKEWDERLEKAVALKLETDDFSDEACKATAETKLEQTLASAKAISATESARRLRAKELDEEYAQVAAYGALRSGMGASALVEALRNADAWAYRVLEEARPLAVSNSKECAE